MSNTLLRPLIPDDVNGDVVPPPKPDFRPPKQVFSDWLYRHRQDGIAVVLLIASIFGGAAVFWRIMGSVPSVIGEHNPYAWTYFNCIYFCVQMICSIGYGDFSPLSLPSSGRVFLTFYSYFGRGVAWIALQTVPDLIESLAYGCLKRCLPYERGVKFFTPKKKIFLTLGLILVSSTVGAFVFSPLEGWSYGDSVYYSIITLTTIGYGDFAPITFHGRLFFIFFVLLQMGAFFHYIESFLEYIVKNVRDAPPEKNVRCCGGGFRAFWKRNWRWIMSLTGFACYVVIGGFIAFIVEGGAWITYDPFEEPYPVVNTSLPWTFGNSVYACMEIVTTVAYADFIPVSPGGKVFVCIYALGGMLVLTFTEVEIAIRLLALGVRGFVIRLRKGGAGVIRHSAVVPFSLRAPETYIPWDADSTRLTTCGRIKWFFQSEFGRFVVFSISYAGWCFLCGAVFSTLELDNGNSAAVLSEAVFWSYQGITTTGFSYPNPGQYLTSGLSRIFWFPYVVIGLLLITAMLTAAGDLIQRILGMTPSRAQLEAIRRGKALTLSLSQSPFELGNVVDL